MPPPPKSDDCEHHGYFRRRHCVNIAKTMVSATAAKD